MNWATWSIRDPIPAILVFVLLVIAGVMSFHALQIKNMPDFEMNQFQIALALPGASANQLEIEVARPAEEALTTLHGVKFMRSTISEGLVSIRVDFDFDLQPAELRFGIKEAIDRIRSTLPPDLEEASIRQLTLAGGAPTITYALTSAELDEEALSWYVQNTVSRAIVGLPGVFQFQMLGGVNREAQVDLDPVRLTAVNLTASEVSRALKRMQKEASGGQSRVGGAEEGIRTVATVREVADLDSLPIVLPNGSHVRLDEIAAIHDGVSERSSTARFDGRLAVGFRVLHSTGANELELCAVVQRAVAELATQNPKVKFELVNSMADEVRNEYRNSMHMLIEGALLAVLVIWMFLGTWRATLIGALALPLSILPTFAGMYAAGFTLNTITLLALSVVVGILVDDAIVEIENIRTHMKAGLGVKPATEKAVIEIGRAVVATTLTLMIVFLPMSFMKGFSGLVFRQFGWTAFAAVFASLLVARVMTPLLALHLLKPNREADSGPGAAMGWYVGLVRWCLGHRAVVLGLTALFVAVSILLWARLPTGFVPAEDGGYTTISVELPPGATLEQTLTIAEEARRAMMGKPDALSGVAHVFTVAGQSSIDRNGVTGGMAEVHRANMKVALAPWGQRPSEEGVEAQIRDRLFKIPGARFSVNGARFGARVNVILSGANPVTLLATAQAVESEVATVPGLTGVNTTASQGRTDIVIRPDLTRATELGVTSEAIADTVRIGTSGDFSPNLAKLNLDSRQLDIRVRLASATREDPETIGQLRVQGRSGLIPLSAIAAVSIESGPEKIERYNRNRHVTISADLGGMPLGEALAKIAKLPTMAALPEGVEWVRGDEAELMDELFAGFGQVLILAAICVYALLVLLFKNFSHPLTILSAAPLSAGGALMGVWISGSEIGMSVLIGFVMLLGIATKNSILLVDYALVAMRDRGLKEVDALLEACQKRVRPIVMTSVAMIAGMAPLALGFGNGDLSLSRPMAAAVIGGLLSSTALTLVVVPVVFVYVAGWAAWVRRI